jgi:hypothetical protein
MNNSIPGASSMLSTGSPTCGYPTIQSSTGIQGSIVFPLSTTPYIALQWDPFYSTTPQFNLWIMNPSTPTNPCSSAFNPGRIGCSIGVPAVKDTITYEVNYTSTGNMLGARVADSTSGTNCSFKLGLSPYGFSPPSPGKYWIFVEGNTGGLSADWTLYQVTIFPTAVSEACNEADGNGDFQGQQKGNFSFDNDGCMDGDQNNVQSTNRGDGRDFHSTQINTASFDKATNSITITGVGVSAGLPVAFTFVAVETGLTTPGWVSFAFSDGYTNAGTLINGSVLLH